MEDLLKSDTLFFGFLVLTVLISVLVLVGVELREHRRTMADLEKLLRKRNIL